MGSSHSKLAGAITCRSAMQCSSADTAAAAAAVAHARGDAADSMPQHSTTIQDLPPLMLAQIFSRHLQWEDLFGGVPLVCTAWHDLALTHVAPEQLGFEFDLVDDKTPCGGLGGGGRNAPHGGGHKGLLQLLLSAPHRLLLRAMGQAPPPAAQEGGGEQDAGGDAAPSSDEQELALLHAPWAAWLQHCGSRLQDFSMSITNLDSNCATAQCHLKETLLNALADSASSPSMVPAALAPAGSGHKLLCSSGSDAYSTTSATGSSGDLLKVVAYTAGSAGSTSSSDSSCSSEPGSPFSTSNADFDITSTSTSISTSISTASSTSTSTKRSGDTLQLKSLHLKVPLFEYDVLLLADNICSKAPQLRSLSLVGYSTSGTVTTRLAKASSSGGGSAAGCACLDAGDAGGLGRVSRHRLPVGRGRGRAAATAAAAASGSTLGQPGGEGPQGQQGGGGGAPPAGAQQHQGLRGGPRPGSGRGGFITGSSLKQLMSAAPQLDSLTFACRQLYKLSWLAPATQLTHLSLRDCSLGPDLLQELAGLKLARLRSLDLSGSRGLGGAEAEAHLRLLGKVAAGGLECLDISGWDLSAAAGRSRALAPLAGLRRLSVLKMECCGLPGWELEAGQLPRLHSLSLSGNALDLRGVAAACSITQLRQLDLDCVAPKELVLQAPQDAPLGHQGAVCWGGMQPMPHLTALSLASNCWPDASLPDRGPGVPFRAFKFGLCHTLARMPCLKRVDLSACHTWTPWKALPLLLGSLPSSVSEVVLDGAAEGLRTADFEALARLPGLRVLSVCGCNVRDKHATALRGVHGLQRLVLRDNNLGPEGLSRLLAGLNQLQMLDVRGNARLSRATAQCSTCTQCESVRAAIAARPHLLVMRD